MRNVKSVLIGLTLAAAASTFAVTAQADADARADSVAADVHADYSFLCSIAPLLCREAPGRENDFPRWGLGN